MAINTIPQGSKVKLQFHNGVDEYGKPILKSKTLSKVKSQATNEAIYESMVSLTSLQTLPIVAVKRIDEVELEEIV